MPAADRFLRRAIIWYAIIEAVVIVAALVTGRPR